MNKTVFYWGPFIDRNVATKKAIFNSAKAVNQYSKKYFAKIINAVGEWSHEEVKENKELFYNTNVNFFESLPKYGFFKSRVSFFLIFFLSWFNLKKILREEKPTFLIIHLIVSLPMLLFFFNDFKTKLILRISGKPKLNFIRLTFWKFMNKKINKVFCPTEETKNLLINLKIFDNNKIFILSDPVFELKDFVKKKNEIIEKQNFKNNNFILIGRLTNQKNFDLIIEACTKINYELGNHVIYILGDGELHNKLESKIKTYQLQNKIILLGKVDNVYKYLFNSKAFILTSLWEDPGFVVVEAALNNTPIIASNCKSGPSEILENGKGGLLFKNNDLNSIVDKILFFLRDDKNNIKMRSVYAKKNIRKFSFFRHYINLIKLLDQTSL